MCWLQHNRTSRGLRPTYALYGLGLVPFLCLARRGQDLWPVLAGSVRLLLIAMGGWWLTSLQAPAWTVFALVGVGLAAYGIATTLSIYFVPWGRRGDRARR